MRVPWTSFPPLKRAWHFLTVLVRRTLAASLTRSAAQLAYYSLFALFPFLMMLVSLARYLPIEGGVDAILARASAVLPPAGYQVIEKQLHGVVGEAHPSLLSTGFLLTMWASSRAVDALRVALNRANGVTETRSFLRREAIAFGFTIAAAISLLLGFALLVLGSHAGVAVVERLGFGPGVQQAMALTRWPLTIALVVLLASCSYSFLPDSKRGFRLGSLGALAATGAWWVATWGFSRYVENFGSFNLAYGSLGGVMLLLTWIYFSGFVFLVGAEIDAIRAGLVQPQSAP